MTAFNIACAAESENLALERVQVRTGVEMVLGDATRGRYYLAEDAAGAAGQVMITREWSDWRNGWIWWLQSVYVRADARRAGVFTALLQHTEAEARREGVSFIRLYVDRDNTAAEGTYLGNGFEQAHYRMLEKSLEPDA
ncbi:MAG: GNAT family N-acetyltransferase [Gammaproteobacteria bacterium]